MKSPYKALVLRELEALSAGHRLCYIDSYQIITEVYMKDVWPHSR